MRVFFGFMKRVFVGFLWFLVIYFAALFIGGAIAGAGADVQPGADAAANFAKGSAAGEAFGKKWGSALLIGSLILSVGGTILGILPGTKRKPPKEPTS